MQNDDFYNENILSSSEKDYSELDFLNQTISQYGHKTYKKDEIKDIKDFDFDSVNKVKTDFFNKNLKKIQTNILLDQENHSQISPGQKSKGNEAKGEYIFFKTLKSMDKTKNLLLTSNDFNITYKDNIANKNKYNNSLSPLFDNNNFTTDKFMFPIELYNTIKLDNEKKDENNKICKIAKSVSNFSNKISTQNNSRINSVAYKRGPYKKKVKGNINEINIFDKCFPFKTGKGIINITTKYNYDPFEVDNKEATTMDFADEKTNKANELILLNNINNNDNNKNNENTENDLYLMKFTTKKYYYSESGRRKKIKKKCKYKADIIRKKIKSRFHKSLKNIINKNLKNSGCKYLFDCLSQCFIGNMSKILNNKCLDMTYKELIMQDFSNKLSNYRHTSKDSEKFEKNMKVLGYLERNPEICKKSGFDIVQNLKYRDLLNNYFHSAEFEESLNEIKKEDESEDYLQSYIYKAKNYIDFYSNILPSDNKENNNNDINSNSEDDDEGDEEDELTYLQVLK